MVRSRRPPGCRRSLSGHPRRPGRPGGQPHRVPVAAVPGRPQAVPGPAHRLSPGRARMPLAVVAGRPIIRSRYEMLVGREAGLPVGTQITIGRLVFTVVGLTEGIVSNAGDPVAFVSLQDGQEIQFLKPNEAVRNDRARLDAAVQSAPALRDVPAETLRPIARTPSGERGPGPPPAGRRRRGGRAADRALELHRALTTPEQEQVLAESVIDRGRRQRCCSGPFSWSSRWSSSR